MLDAERWVSVINHILPRVEFCRLCRRLRVSAHSLLPQIALSCITPVKPPPVDTRLIYNVVLRDRCLFAEYSRRIYHALRINFLRPRKRTPMRKTDYMHRARRNLKRKFLSTDATECNLFRAIDISRLWTAFNDSMLSKNAERCMQPYWSRINQRCNLMLWSNTISLYRDNE